jgi:predicted O-linked N-acetylglucosamine transferase (SPINDLY family)
VELEPRLADVHQGLCTLLRIGGNFPGCRQAADRYAQFCSDFDQIRVLVTLVKCYLESGLNELAQQYFQELEAKLLQPNVTLRDPEVRLIYEDLVFSLPYLRDRIDLNGHLNKLIGSAYSQLCLPAVPSYSPLPKVEGEALRIGIISKHLRRHSVGWCSRGIIKEWSKLTPHLHLYMTGRGGSDDITAAFKEMTPNFFDFSAKSHLELLAKLREDNLDVLIDMDSVMNPSHAVILHHAPARIVTSWLGCEPPYISENNYYLCDRHTHPESVQPHYREQLLRMPDFAVAIGEFPTKPLDRVVARQNLGISPGMVAYLSVATGHKVNPDSVRSHVSILNQVPNSILLHKGFCDVDIVRSLYQQACQNVGIDPERCRFMSRQQLEEDHRAFYQIADIALDTYPYNGGTHNLESLWFDLPVVTLCGKTATSRMGYSFLKALGISEGVAHDWQEYTEWGVKLGLDQNLRSQIQAKIKQSKQPETLSPIWNPAKFAQDAYDLFQSILDGGVI